MSLTPTQEAEADYIFSRDESPESLPLSDPALTNPQAA